MWTPKRVLLLTVGFALFCGAYLVYAHFLGGINGLPPLPEDYGPINPGDPDKTTDIPPEPRENQADQKLRIAFGPDCDEVTKRNIRVELQSRGMVLAANDVKVLDGRVKLMPFSVAIFGKDSDASKFPEINTVQCHEAILTFDKPVNNIAEMANRKITGGELSGDIHILNNRRTPQRDDDLSLLTQGPLFYQESVHMVWTGADIEVLDPQSKPKPMVIRGTGMHLYLTPESKADAATDAAAPHAKPNSSIKAERIEIQRDVVMNLWVDARSGFLGGGKEDKVGTPPPAQTPLEEKAKVMITTQGPFRYDLLTDQATFDISHHPGPGPNLVKVERIHEAEEKYDRLECDHLEIQFQRKNAGPGQAARDDHGEGLDIETVRATGKDVVLTSDAEMLDAHCIDFFHDKKNHLSILKGEPRMWALKDGNELEAPELQLLDVKGAQQATALGEGRIRMLDKKTGERTLEANWKKKLVYGKDGPHDLLWLTGPASFVDREHAQELQAQQHIKVWLEPTKEGKPAPGGDPQRASPHHVDALGQVQALAPNLRVHDTDHLELWFKDAPVRPLSATPPARESSPLEKVADRASQPETSRSPSSREPARSAAPAAVKTEAAAPPASAVPSASASADPAKPKNPMDLTAREVVGYILRTENKNELDELTCMGAARVVQEPLAPEDKRVDLRGEKLHLVRQADGNILTVQGDYGQVQLDKLFIVGPEVTIDQTTNEAWSRTMGVMRLPSNTTLGGAKATRPVDTRPAPPADVTISWQQNMLFDGKDATFSGGVRAEQNNAHLACNAMQVTLDRKVSFREGDKGKEPAKVQHVVCEGDVWVEDSKSEGARIVAYQRIDCPELDVDNDEDKDDSLVHAGGPGTVRIFQLGTKTDIVPSPGGVSAPVAGPGTNRGPKTPPAKSKDEGEPKLTCVKYQGSMHANNKKGLATFRDKVVMIQVPTDDPGFRINENHLPAGYVYMSCEKLEVLKNKLPDGKTYQEMRAYGKVAIETQEFSGNADVVKYDESKEQVILEGSPGNDAVLEQQKVRGGDGQTLRGKKITYLRSTGEVHVEYGRGVRFSQ